MKGIPKVRKWQSRGRTMEVAEMGLTILDILSRRDQPQAVSYLMEAMCLGVGKSGHVVQALLLLHETGNIQGDGKVSRFRLSADTTKVSITPAGRELLAASKSRLELGRQLLGITPEDEDKEGPARETGGAPEE